MFRSVIVLSLSIFLFGTISAQWTQLNDIPYINHHSNGFGFNGKGYIIQGEPSFIDGESRNAMWEYDPITDSWTRIGVFPGVARGFGIGDDMDGKYYFGFGTGRNDLWVYDPSDNSYQELPSCPCAGRAHPGFVAHNGQIFMGSGSGATSDLRDWWVYDVASEVWSQKDNIPGQIRHHPFQFGIDNAIYLGGGHRDNWSKYDIDTETWSEIDDLPSGRVAGTQFSHKGRGFVLAGDRADHEALTFDQFLMYEPETDEWQRLPFEMDMHRWACSSFIIEDDVYYFGGIGYLGGSDLRMWKFDLSNVDCLAPLDVFSASTDANSADLIWASSPDGTSDTLQWREVGSTDWNVVLDPQPVYVLEGLESCTEYEFRVNTNCGSKSTFSESSRFTTTNCGSCVDETFCDVASQFFAVTVYIGSVKLNDFLNETDDPNFIGYSEFTASNDVILAPGEFLDVEIKPTYDGGGTDNVFIKSWIDFDADGTFQDDELVIDEAGITDVLTQSIQIPFDTEPGVVRIRIMMEQSPLTGPCNGTAFFDGEVEDYCITVSEVSSNQDIVEGSSTISPNPNNGLFELEYFNANRFEIYNSSGMLVSKGVLNSRQEERSFQMIDVQNLKPGYFILRLTGTEQSEILRFVKH